MFLTDHILESVPHRQIVFSIPKMLRIYFLYNRNLLPKLSHCGWETVKEVFQTTMGRNDVVPGMAMDIQTYGRWANWNPHLHGVVSDGCFDEEGNFYLLPRISVITLEKVFAGKVLAMLLREEAITKDLAEMILSWRHSGFSSHAKVRLEQGDREGLQSLAQYIVRCPISEEKLLLSPDGQTVICKSVHKPDVKKNFAVYDVLEFLAALSSHIPAAGKKMVLYYGWYSQASRGKRKREGKSLGDEIAFHQFDDDNRILRYRWSQLIKMIYADPLICSRCGGRMRIIAFIRDKVVIERILKHLGLSEELPHAHSPPHTGPPEPPITYEPFYDDLPLSEQAELAQTVR
jgi:hypothetical protein